MKLTVSIFLIFLVLPVTTVIMTQPDEPVNNCTEINKDLSKFCLSYIPKYYNSDFLTYIGHTKAWIYRRADKAGVSLGKHQINYLVNYSFFEDAVNCHLTASGDTNLNMTRTPTEFDAAYKLVATDNEASNTENTDL